VRARRDRSAQHRLAEAGKGTGAVDHRADAVHQFGERLGALRVGAAQLGAADRIRQLAERGAVAAAQDRIDAAEPRLVDHEPAGEPVAPYTRTRRACVMSG
jgi:hypothetical protein